MSPSSFFSGDNWHLLSLKSMAVQTQRAGKGSVRAPLSPAIGIPTGGKPCDCPEWGKSLSHRSDLSPACEFTLERDATNVGSVGSASIRACVRSRTRELTEEKSPTACGECGRRVHNSLGFSAHQRTRVGDRSNVFKASSVKTRRDLPHTRVWTAAGPTGMGRGYRSQPQRPYLVTARSRGLGSTAQGFLIRAVGTA